MGATLRLLFAAGMCVWSALLVSESNALWGWCAALWGVAAGMSLSDVLRRVTED